MTPDALSDRLADAVRRLDASVFYDDDDGDDAADAGEVRSVAADLAELRLAIDRAQIIVSERAPRIVSVEAIEGGTEVYRVSVASTIVLGFLRLVRDLSGNPKHWIARSLGDPGGCDAGTIRKFPGSDRDAAVGWLLQSEKVTNGKVAA